jgi:hypothetical protein
LKSLGCGCPATPASEIKHLDQVLTGRGPYPVGGLSFTATRARRNLAEIDVPGGWREA